jgi:DNA-binding transcriptional ArsR family regulator
MADRVIQDVEQLKSFAHPLRQRLYRLLVQLGPLTNADLSAKLGGADPGLVSYHIRRLVKGGFVEDVPDLATDRRQRWWRAVSGNTSWSSLDFDTPEGREVAKGLKSQMVVSEFERLRDFATNQDRWSMAWREAATSSDSYLRLTPEELTQLSADLHEVLRRYSTSNREPSPEAVPVFLFLHAFPEHP